jgi:glycosyltransferase involved in cell wall biosynthesis
LKNVDSIQPTVYYQSEERSIVSPSPIRAKNIMVLLPAFNEAGAIGHVIEGVQQVLPQADIVVIDDCSTDNTVQVARNAGATVVCIPCNLGIGGAVQTGFKFAREKNYDVVIRLDGDGQHDPNEVPTLYAALSSGRADAVFGSRFIGKDSDMKIPIGRRLGIKTFAFLVTILTRQRATDTTSGFMCLNRYAVGMLADYLPQDYPEVEGRIILHKAGLKTLELPVLMRSRIAGMSSINNWRSIYYAFKVSVAALIGAMKDIPAVQKELEYDSHSHNSASRRHSGQSYFVACDHTTDTEAQIT